MADPIGTVVYEGTLSLRDARRKYFDAWGFGDGGYEATWVELKKIAGIPIGFPNSDARRRAVKLHDLHHVLTGYRADWTGEAEIAAWELGAGCHRHFAAWVLNLLALQYGFWIAPRPVVRALARGRRSEALYTASELDDSLLTESVAAMRERLHIPEDASVRVGIGDLVAFVAWYALGLATWTWPLALVAMLVA